MMDESHWCMLKRLYLTPFNRPYVDFLKYVMDKKVISKCKNIFPFDIERTEETSFVLRIYLTIERAHHCMIAPIKSEYIVDMLELICTRPAWS